MMKKKESAGKRIWNNRTQILEGIKNRVFQTEAVEEEPETKTTEEQKEAAAWKAFNVTVNSIKKIK